VERNEPAIFPVDSVIDGWAEALQKMKEGSKWRLFIPADLAYGEKGAAGLIGPNSVLVFDVELIEIV
jgi:FKBP-type peptidyl-prolyl cis-trans isomerase FklB